MKPQLKSKTVWLGMLITLLSILGLVAGEPWIQDYPQVVAVLGIITGVLTVIIRQFTTQPVSNGLRRKS